jgi:hypothetical protein
VIFRHSVELTVSELDGMDWMGSTDSTDSTDWADWSGLTGQDRPDQTSLAMWMRMGWG